jgi:hypothetical protein
VNVCEQKHCAWLVEWIDGCLYGCMDGWMDNILKYFLTFSSISLIS